MAKKKQNTKITQSAYAEHEHKLIALSSLARGLCLDAHISIEVNEDHWHWDSMRRVLQIYKKDLAERSLEYCAMVVAREIGLLHLSRHFLFRCDFPSMTALRYYLDCLDSARVMNWMKLRYPGVDDWYEKSQEEIPGLIEQTPIFIQFAQICMDIQRAKNGLNETVIEAFQEIAEAYFEYIEIYPNRREYLSREELKQIPLKADEIDTSLDIQSSTALRSSYEFQVKPLLYLYQQHPSPKEQLIQLAAVEAFYLFEEEILPVLRRLYDQNIDELTSLLNHQQNASEAKETLKNGQDLSEFLNRAREELNQKGITPPKSSLLRELSRDIFDGLIKQKEQARVVQGGDLQEYEDESIDPNHQEPQQAPLEMNQINFFENEYEQSFQFISLQIDQLLKYFEDLLLPKQRMKSKSGYPSGNHIDLKQLMKYEADPRIYDRLWTRKNVPSRRNIAVLLLVDLSGSMRGDKVYHATLGTILLAETLERLKINFSIYGFQDQLISLVDFYQGLDLSAKSNIIAMQEEVDGTRLNGNNNPHYNDDGPCLSEAALILSEQSASERYLIVVSDGQPEGCRSTKQDLHHSIEEINAQKEIQLMALGLGPNTQHVVDFYAEQGIADVPLDQFSVEIAKLLEKIIIQI